MARRRRRIARGGRPASRFAPGSAGDGRTLSWEQLIVVEDYVTDLVAFPFNANVVGPKTISYVSLMPQNMTRGVVTLERIRGNISWYWQDVDIADSSFHELPMQIALVPLQNGAIVNAAVLNPTDPFDLESSKIIWRYNFFPELESGTVPLIDGVRRYHQPGVTLQVDVKSKRRFARDEYALILVLQRDTTKIGNYICSIDLRALFRATDGL